MIGERVTGAGVLRCQPETLLSGPVARSAEPGQGAGAALTHEAVRLAQKAGARTVDLTSRPARQAANRLHERLGFELRETNAYRYATQS